MNKNFIMLAQNSKYNYVEQACVCAMSIHSTIDNANVSLITNDKVPEKYLDLFDNIIPIPWGDLAEKHEWKIHNRWKILHVLPYDDAIVLDTDMLILDDISHWFEFLKKYPIFFTSRVKTYRNEWVENDFYRKKFTKHNLPNLYTGLHYITKDPFAFEFYSVLDKIIQNWKDFAGDIQKEASVDVAAALAASIIGCEESVTNSNVTYPTFVHMKPNIQGWKDISETWQNKVSAYFTNKNELWIGNHQQQGVFHYTEKDFIKEDIKKIYESSLGIL